MKHKERDAELEELTRCEANAIREIRYAAEHPHYGHAVLKGLNYLQRACASLVRLGERDGLLAGHCFARFGLWLKDAGKIDEANLAFRHASNFYENSQ